MSFVLSFLRLIQMGFIAKPVKIEMLEIFQLIADDMRAPGGPRALKARSDQLRYFDPFPLPAAAAAAGGGTAVVAGGGAAAAALLLS